MGLYLGNTRYRLFVGDDRVKAEKKIDNFQMIAEEDGCVFTITNLFPF